MITLMKEITNAKVFLIHGLLTPPYTHTLLRQLADFPLLILCSSYTVTIGGLSVKKVILYYGFSTQKRLIIQFFSDSLIINIPPAPFKGGDVMVSIHERHFGQPLTLQRCIILRQVFGYVKKVLELCGVEVTET